MQISGKHIHLRDIQAKDKDSLIYWLQPHHNWHKFNGPYYPPSPSDKIIDIVEKGISSEPPDPRRRLLIVDKKTDEIMGMTTCYWISRETDWMAIGIAIYNPDNWSKGYGYDALRLWCDYLFEAYPNFVRLDMRTWSGNIGMMKLAEKLGFKLEATFRKARIVEDKYYDGLGYGILREEWEQR